MEDFKLLQPVAGPHQSAVAFSVGDTTATKALVLLHGRGGSAADILSLTRTLPGNYVAVAPEAVGHVWYPERFLLPQQANEPYLSSSLAVIEAVIATLVEQGYQTNQIILAGFSQGACLAAEYVKRHPAPYAGLVVMSGGLIGDDAEVGEAQPVSLSGMPVYIGCDSDDVFIPLSRVQATAAFFTNCDAKVSLEIFSDFGHAVHPTAIDVLTGLLAG